MDADRFEGGLYTTLSENTFKNLRINIKNSEDDWTMSDYLSRHFGMKIGETTTCLSCHKNKAPNIL